MKVLDKIISAFLVLFGATTVNAAYPCTTDPCRVYRSIMDNPVIGLIFIFIAITAATCIVLAISFVYYIAKNKKGKSKEHR